MLGSASAGQWTQLLAAFRHGLGETGHVEGGNVGIEYRWAEGQIDRLPTLAADLVAKRVAVIVTMGGVASALAAKAATSAIPIVFSDGGDDPVALGLVRGLNRPGGNATGMTLLAAVLDAKRLELLHEMLPQIRVIAALVNPKRDRAAVQASALHEAARKLGLRLHLFGASTEQDIAPAFDALVREGAGALVVGADPYLFSRREQIVALAARHNMPAIFQWRDFTAAGGLVSYGASLADAYRQLGVYAGRILRGEKPGDLPVFQPTKFELVINVKTATALGVVVPPFFLSRADELIE